MMRWLLVLALPAALFLPTPAARAEEKEGRSLNAPYVHVVIFRLKKDAPADAAKGLIDDAHALLAKIPAVRGVQAGRPAAKSTPDVARKDFDVGLVILLDDAAALTQYLEHPLHLQYVEKHGKHIEMEKLDVFDFEKTGK